MTPYSRNKEGIRIPVDVLRLDDLPVAMDKMGWTMSAKLMRRWFATAPAYAMPSEIRKGTNIDYLALPTSQIEEKIIKRDWLMGFESVRDMAELLYSEWNTPKGIEQLTHRLRNAAWNPGKTTKLGQGMKFAKELDNNAQVNYREFGAYLDTFDDLFGSIFKATLKLAVVGKASRSWLSKQDIFEIERIGIYMRDTYDFNADWHSDALLGLGVWNRDRLLTKAQTLDYKASPPYLIATKYPGYVPVYNADFRRWQKANNEGGDFFVFSDVMWLMPKVSHVIL